MKAPKQKGKFEANRVFVVNNALRFSPELASEIGVNESLLFLQIEFWIAISNNVRDGYKWTYQSVSEINLVFSHLSRATIARTLQSLIKKKLLVVGNYNSHHYDKTRWFRVNEEGARSLRSITWLPY